MGVKTDSLSILKQMSDYQRIPSKAEALHLHDKQVTGQTKW
ncbi:protein of unknown function [Shewanella benthica]|uniref:Uncharacterized protein n=1 Tax=Shewanella benthica TaxID=43661 RepID=A0A330LVD7_9GAMM|nr:protein of unknown function [Shewanella benthica]